MTVQINIFGESAKKETDELARKKKSRIGMKMLA